MPNQPWYAEICLDCECPDPNEPLVDCDCPCHGAGGGEAEPDPEPILTTPAHAKQYAAMKAALERVVALCSGKESVECRNHAYYDACVLAVVESVAKIALAGEIVTLEGKVAYVPEA